MIDRDTFALFVNLKRDGRGNGSLKYEENGSFE